MSNYDINIKKCNCIKEANISIKANNLNIKYGINGTGKSTIGKAISLSVSRSQEEFCEELCPYGTNMEDKSELPMISKLPYSKIKIFNDEYVGEYLFENDGKVGDAFQVFLKNTECDSLTEQINQLLIDLQGNFRDDDSTPQKLKEFLRRFTDIVKYKDGEVSKSGGIGDFLKGNGCGFNNYKELGVYKPFYEDRKFSEVTKWAKWRRDGIDQMSGNVCPFCACKMNEENINKQNNVIKKVFKNSALSTANAIFNFLDDGVKSGYIKQEAARAFANYVGNVAKEQELHSEVKCLAVETEYLASKIEQIGLFRPMNINSEQLNKIEGILDAMKIDERQIEKFYNTALIKEWANNISIKLNKLKEKNDELKGLFNKHRVKLEKLIKNRREDINEFLLLAGFPYKFVLLPDGERRATTYLEPVGNENEEVHELKKHLSWGEKNAFGLVMFMFEAISENPDLIILDDPISSFDSIKKFAVVRRLFDNKKESFKDKTVLMFTHDFQPIIDYAYNEIFKHLGVTTQVDISMLRNEDGIIKEIHIGKEDFCNVVNFTKSIVDDNRYPMAVRIVNLRKYIELTINNYSEAPEYEVLSNLIHGRTIPTDKNGNQLESSIFENGCSRIGAYFSNMTYEEILKEVSDENLQILLSGDNAYEKVIAFRLRLERNETLRANLRRNYPATYKFINETNHIENDYVFQLNPSKFFFIPENCLNELNSCIQQTK